MLRTRKFPLNDSPTYQNTKAQLHTLIALQHIFPDKRKLHEIKIKQALHSFKTV